MPGSSREERLAELLAAFLEAVESGQKPNLQEWQAHNPDLAEELAAFVRNEEHIRGLAAPLRGEGPSNHSSGPVAAENRTVAAPSVASGAPLLLPAGHLFGDFEILEEIAQGGMGIVYRARQLSLNRLVALKVVLRGAFADQEERARFRAEAEAAARLDHSNIVPIYHVGEFEGRPYLCLKLIEGGSLAQRLKGTPLPIPEAVRLVEILAGAIHYAHQRGIVHRDLKPGNILLATGGPPPSKHLSPARVSGFGPDPVDPLITDFGLAKQMGGSENLTQTGQVIGTPCYMAPEQAWGHRGRIGPAADIYALGAILYETLTGRPPFQAATPYETLDLVRTQEPAPPRILNPKVNQDLQSICLKCLEKEPGDRYGSAEALADDLRRFRNSEPVSVRTYNVLLRITRALGKRSPTEDEFHFWGTMLLWFAGIVLVGHLVTFVLIKTQLPRNLGVLTRTSEFGLGGLVFWLYRRRRRSPMVGAERQLWSVWLGYLVAWVVGALAIRLLVDQGIIVCGPTGPLGWEELLVYPFSASLSGLSFFVMGGLYWGRYYALGFAFLLLALLLPLHLTWAPLEFGGLWAAALVAIGLHLRRLAFEAAKETP
jgi:serine/threonine protein kinase